MNSSQSAQTLNPAPVHDSVWIKQVLAGNEEAFAHLINKYKDQLFELASRILKNRAEAEDILQDAFLQAYRHLGDFRNDSQFSTWLYSIVLNRVRNRMRQNKVLHWYSLDVRRTDREDVQLPELPHKSPSLDTLTEKKMELERVHRVVGGFPLHYQSIFIMHYFHNLPLEEVAHRLGRPLGTVKVYLHRARKLLYKRLKAESAPAAEAAAAQTPAESELALSSY
jgi:RNA polymerase sigma-70 factor (ECF subfamily)